MWNLLIFQVQHKQLLCIAHVTQTRWTQTAKRARLDEDTEKEDSKHHEMFAGMFSTAMEMIEEEREVIDANDAELKKGGKKHLKR